MTSTFLKQLVPLRHRVRILHRQVTGKWPNLAAPQSFSDKLCWRKAFLGRFPEARALLGLTCDKVTVRGFLQSIGLHENLTSPFYCGLNWDEVAQNQLPDRYLVKASHGSTWNHFVHDRDTEDYAALRSKCNDWLKKKWGATAGEWWYSMTTPRILAEEWLSDGLNQVPLDYKFHVAQGDTILIQVDRKYEGPYRRRLYLPPWTPIDATFNEKALDKPQDPPVQIDKMQELASLIGSHFDYCRVDFFVCNSRIIIGEITHAPASGWLRFSDSSLDLSLGEKLPKYSEQWKWKPTRAYQQNADAAFGSSAL